MNHCRRLLAALGAGAIAFGSFGLDAAAQVETTDSGQAYPNKPIRIIVPYTPGGPTDLVGRVVAQWLTEAWKRQAVIDNRPGAGSAIGHDIGAKAAPDGYTLLLGTSAGLVLNPLLYKVPYQPLKDFAPISLTVINPQILVAHPSLPANSIGELIALAKSKPGQINCASPGAGTPNHLGCELLNALAAISTTHVPYKGTGPAITDLIGGQVQLLFSSMPATLPQVKAGKLKALAMGGTKRSNAVPNVPTVAETLPGFECITWYGLFAPARTPAQITVKLNAEIVKMIATPRISEYLESQGSEPVSSTPEQLLGYIKEGTEKWAKLIKTAGIKIE